MPDPSPLDPSKARQNVVSIRLCNYAISLDYLVDLAGEYYGKLLTGDDGRPDFEFERLEGEDDDSWAGRRMLAFQAAVAGFWKPSEPGADDERYRNAEDP